jgi:PPOX class probable F420-dependent enzyme
MTALPPAVADFVSSARVGRLGTADAAGQPLVVPVCYAFDGAAFFSAIDAKPKARAGRDLQRVRNIRENPRVSLAIDHYADDWQELRWVIVQGTAEILTAGGDYARGVALLLDKYAQYRAMGLDPQAMIKVTPRTVIRWAFSR